MSFSDETLGAYLDGELDAAERQRIESAIAEDPELAQRLERLRLVQNKLLAGFGGVTQEPVPQHLLDVVHSAGGPSVAALPRANALRRPRLPWSATELMALAATIVIGVGLTYFLWSSSRGDGTGLQSGALARGAVAQALSNQLASEQPHDALVRVGLTFRDKSGAYCRSFALKAARRAGLACRDGDGWRVQALAKLQLPVAGEATPAGNELPLAIVRVMEDRIVGEPLDATAERAARRANWKGLR